MARWGNSFFEDDLAADIQAEFEQMVADGVAPSEAAAGLLSTDISYEILNEFPEDERDEMFWEESAGLIFAATVLQLEHNALQPETKVLAIQAIAAERDMGADDERLTLLAELEQRLSK